MDKRVLAQFFDRKDASEQLNILLIQRNEVDSLIKRHQERGLPNSPEYIGWLERYMELTLQVDALKSASVGESVK